MSWLRLNTGLVLILALGIGGCGKKEEQPAPPQATPPAAPSAAPAPPPAPPAPAPAPATAPGPTVIAPTPAPATMPTTEPAAVATPAPGAPGQMSAAEAQGTLDQAITYIKEKKYDLANTTLDKLEASKASLPASMQGQITNARALLNAAQASGGNLPTSMPTSMPGGLQGLFNK